MHGCGSLDWAAVMANSFIGLIFIVLNELQLTKHANQVRKCPHLIMYIGHVVKLIKDYPLNIKVSSMFFIVSFIGFCHTVYPEASIFNLNV